MRKLRKYVVTKEFKEYLPEPTNFEIVEEAITRLASGEFLVKAEYISVDPYMRSFANRLQVPYEQFGYQVGKVIESKNSEFPVDSYVVSHSGWRDYAVLNGECDEMMGMKPYKPEIGNLPLSLSVGALGMPGIAAYLGLLEICKPSRGEKVCVSSAAGTVGSLVGQIAKLNGCVVIGIAGSHEKVQYLKQELGFTYALNYKTVDIKENLQSIAPDGIDIYFDNVGGGLSSSVIECLKEYGRVAICGSISTYGQDLRRKKPKYPVSAKVESFSFTQWEWSKQCAALQQLKEWVQNGSIRTKESVADGFEKLPAALVAMLKGDNIGKTVVNV